MSNRRNSQPQDVLSFGPFSLLAAERLLKKADEPIPLGGRALVEHVRFLTVPNRA